MTDRPPDRSHGFNSREEYEAHIVAASQSGKLNRALRRAVAKLRAKSRPGTTYTPAEQQAYVDALEGVVKS